MIIAFQVSARRGADTARLAAGIWEARLTTAFGERGCPCFHLAAVFNNAVDGVRDMVEPVTEILVRAAAPARSEWLIHATCAAVRRRACGSLWRCRRLSI